MPSRLPPPNGRSFDSGQRVSRLHPRVRAEGQPRTRPGESTPRVRVARHLRPVAVYELAVRDPVNGLHGGDHTDAREPPDILRVDALRVLDARAPLLPRLAVRSERVKRSSNGAVANRVEAHVQLSSRALPDELDEVRLDQSRDTRAVEHLGGAAAERTVEERLDAPDAEPLVAPARTHAKAHRVRQVRGGEVVRDANRQPPLRAEPLP